MDKKTRTALDKSIKHWERIRDGVDRKIGCTHCALCKLFVAGGCKDCPVYEHTRQDYCFGTPYTAFGLFHGEVLDLGLHFADLENKRGQKQLYQRRIALAQAEIDFLKSLRPKRTRK